MFMGVFNLARDRFADTSIMYCLRKCMVAKNNEARARATTFFCSKCLKCWKSLWFEVKSIRKHKKRWKSFHRIMILKIFLKFSNKKINSSSVSLIPVPMRSDHRDQASFCLFALRDVSVFAKLALWHPRYSLTDIPHLTTWLESKQPGRKLTT